jgi:serine/threonine protein kinase/Flp pilus assembly protein TadD
MSLPELFGPYLLHHRLARGSTAEVFLAQTIGEFPRICAIKRILPELSSVSGFNERFRQDATLLVRMIHGNLVQVLEVGMVEEQPFVAMEPIDGILLPELISQVSAQGPLPAELALYVGLEFCEATTYLHLRRREEQRATQFSSDQAWPLEVMLSFDGVVKIIDLGASGALRLGQVPQARTLRSPGYAVPEILRHLPLDLRSDMFALGLLLWEMMEGRRLVSADPEEYTRQVLAGRWSAPLVQRKDVSGDIIRLVASLLSLDPQKRPTAMESVRRRLVEALRRLAPSYGSANLSQLLWRRCQPLIVLAEEMLEEVLQRSRTDPRLAATVRSNSFSSASAVTRPVVTPQVLKPGDSIPGTRYRLVRTLGEGGFAEVHAAQHIDLDRQVAIKILSPALAQNAEAIAQFRLEARACSRIGHANIVEVTDFGELEDGRFYFAMELLDGQTLTQVLQQGPLAPGRAIGIFRQVAKALQAAHQHGIVHRDLKPDNIMLITRQGRSDFVKVLDFGVMAFSTDATSKRAGTTGYMAPEQVVVNTPSFAMDIYSLGTSLYEVLSGALPYPAEDLEEFIEEQAHHPPPALRSQPGAAELPAALERVISRALERDPAARHASMEDFETDLLRAQKEAGLSSEWDDLPLPGELHDQRRAVQETALEATPRRRTPWWIAAALVLVLGGVGLAVLVGQKRQVAPPPRPVTELQTALDSPRTPAPRPADNPRLAQLLDRALVAAQQGAFVYPPGKSALAYLEAAEALAPQTPSIGELRQRIAGTLEGAGDRLLAAGMKRPAHLLFMEARRFHPSSTTLPRKQASSQMSQEMDQTATMARAPELSRVAWLLSQVQLAVAEGRYLKPAPDSALFFLTELRRIDPTGQATAEAQQAMTGNLRRQADALWQRGEQAQARGIYQMVLMLEPGDSLARQRGVLLPDAGPPITAPSKPPVKAMAAADRARALELVDSGNTLLARGQLTLARQHFFQAVQLNAKETSALSGLAAVAFEEAHYLKTVELAHQALALAPRNGKALLLLGDAYFKLLRRADAQQAWETLLKVDGQNRAAKLRLNKLREEEGR